MVMDLEEERGEEDFYLFLEEERGEEDFYLFFRF